MALNLTVESFLQVVRQSGLIDANQLQTLLSKYADRGIDIKKSQAIADALIADDLVTKWQAEKLLNGKHKGFVLGKYRLLGLLGKGGMSSVYLAEHTPTGERRALKVLHADHADDPQASNRLSREAAVVARLSHPNLVRVIEYDPGCTDRPPFLAMEYVDGVSLQAAVALGGTFTAEATAECGRQAALALQHAWDAGLVHRDVKPANLLLARDGQLKVLDFGLVRLSRNPGRTSVSGKQWLGTAAYVAPEQIADGSAVDCRADVYALGGALYFLLAGHPPFQHADVFERVRGKQHAPPPPIHHLRPDVPEELSAVVAAMLAHRPDRRPPTPAAAAHLLARWADPAFADHLFTRLDRTADDTPSEGTPTTPGPVLSLDPPTVRITAKGATTEVPTICTEVLPQDTVRVAQPTLVRPTTSPTRWLPRFVTVAVAFGLCVAAALITVFLLTR